MEALEFGAYLKKLRKGKKLTIRQLDLYSGVSNSYISQMERGERGIPSPEILKKLSKPLGVDYEVLMVKAGYIEPSKGKTDLDEQAGEYISDEDRILIERFKQLPERDKQFVKEFVDRLYKK